MIINVVIIIYFYFCTLNINDRWQFLIGVCFFVLQEVVFMNENGGDLETRSVTWVVQVGGPVAPSQAGGWPTGPPLERTACNTRVWETPPHRSWEALRRRSWLTCRACIGHGDDDDDDSSIEWECATSATQREREREGERARFTWFFGCFFFRFCFCGEVVRGVRAVAASQCIGFMCG